LDFINFFKGLETVPLYGLGDGRIKVVEILGGTPTDVVMLFGGQSHLAILWTRPIDHSDVLVRIADPMDVQKTGRYQGASSGSGCGRAFAEQLDAESALLFGLAQGGLFGIFVQFHVTPKREPFVEFTMMDEQDLPVPHDENADGEINFVVNVSHDSRYHFRQHETKSESRREIDVPGVRSSSTAAMPATSESWKNPNR